MVLTRVGGLLVLTRVPDLSNWNHLSGMDLPRQCDGDGLHVNSDVKPGRQGIYDGLKLWGLVLVLGAPLFPICRLARRRFYRSYRILY